LPYFFSVNRNKESIALDLKTSTDRAVFEELVAGADILVENFKPGAMQKLGYDRASLHARWPALILASISGFGQTGPYSGLPAYDMVVQAMGGVMSLTGPLGSTGFVPDCSHYPLKPFAALLGDESLKCLVAPNSTPDREAPCTRKYLRTDGRDALWVRRLVT